jgi:hypothetical protein
LILLIIKCLTASGSFLSGKHPPNKILRCDVFTLFLFGPSPVI